MRSTAAGHLAAVDALDHAAVLVGRLSRGGAAWAAVSAALAARRNDPAIAVRAMGAAWTADAAALVLSRVFGRERPCRTRPSLIECPDSSSFPSNHSATAAAAATVLAQASPRSIPLIALGVSAVMAARVRVGVHHVGDVVGGALLGVLVARRFEPKS